MKHLKRGKKLAAMLLLVLAAAMSVQCAAQAAFAPIALEDAAGRKPLEAGYLPEMGGYHDESLTVTLETIRQHDTNILVARVKIVDPSQIRTAMAARYGSTGTVMPDKLAKRVNAVLAVNGDFFNYNSTGYLVRQGHRYRNKTDMTHDVLIIDDKGDFTILVDPTEEKVENFPGTIVNSFNFGPALVVDGEIITTTKEMNIGLEKETQRMGVGQVGPLEYVLAATEGPENEGSDGLTIAEFAQLMKELGAVQAYNLDGGSSSAMMLGGEKINALSSKKMRPICDLLYFSTLVE